MRSKNCETGIVCIYHSGHTTTIPQLGFFHGEEMKSGRLLESS